MPKRKLAAVLSTDAVGYSRLMSENEEATIAALNAAMVIPVDVPIATVGIAGRVAYPCECDGMGLEAATNERG